MTGKKKSTAFRHPAYPEPPAGQILGPVADTGRGLARIVLWAPGAESVCFHLFAEPVFGGPGRRGSFAGAETPGTSNTSGAFIPSDAPVTSLVAAYDSATGCWQTDVDLLTHGLAVPFFYECEVQRDSQKRVVPDPFARSCALWRGAGSLRMACIDTDSASPTFAGAVPVNDGRDYKRPSQAVIYEAHVRDFGGTYLGCVEKLDRIASLGITHLQLLPVQLFGRTDEAKRAFEDPDDPETANYNWGYDPTHYFIPSGWYASEPRDPLCRIRELQTLVRAAHERGLRVILDVVYNHAASTEPWEWLAPGYWFRREPDGSYSSRSGCGNDFESTQPMWRRLFAESLGWLIECFDVDGFRFDLMGLIDTGSMHVAHERCSVLKPQVLFVGEGWKMYNGPPGTTGMDQHAVERPGPVAVFNDEIRDLLKGGGLNEGIKAFLHGNPETSREALFRNFVGLAGINYNPDQPWNSLNYIEAHDGLTAYDNLAVNLSLDPSRPEHHHELVKRLAVGNAALCLSQGIIFLHAGQETARSKRLPPRLRDDPITRERFEAIEGFVRNSFRAGDRVNTMESDMRDDPDKGWLEGYTRGLLTFRRTHARLFAYTRSEIEQAIGEGSLGFVEAQSGGFAWYLREARNWWVFALNPFKEPAFFDLGASLDNDAGWDLAEVQDFLVFADGSNAGDTALPRPEGVGLHRGRLELAPLSSAVMAIQVARGGD